MDPTHPCNLSTGLADSDRSATTPRSPSSPRRTMCRKFRARQSHDDDISSTSSWQPAEGALTW